MAMRTHQRKRVTIIIILLGMLGCIASRSFTPVNGVKNFDDGDKESELEALKRALAKSRAQSRNLKRQNHVLMSEIHALNSTLEAWMDKIRSDSDADPRATWQEVYDEFAFAPGTKDVSFKGQGSEKSYLNGFMKNAAQYFKLAYNDYTEKHPNEPINGNWNFASRESRTDSTGQTKTSGFNASGKV